MTRRPALITQAEVRRIMAGAKQAGVELSIVVRKDAVFFVPVGREMEDELNPLEDWIEKRDARRANQAKDASVGTLIEERLATLMSEEPRGKKSRS